jgi:hypothetical protein
MRVYVGFLNVTLAGEPFLWGKIALNCEIFNAFDWFLFSTSYYY